MRKGKKTLESKRGSLLTRFPNKSLNSDFSIAPSTVRERRRNLSVLEDYNRNHEDDIFECIDTSHTSVLLNSSSSSSGSSSPALSRRASPSLLPKLTRESTPLQLRGLLNNKEETIVSGNSFAHISFINRKMKKHRVTMKNQFKSSQCHDGLSISEEDKTSCCEDLLKT